MANRFTDAAGKALNLAKEAAKEFRSPSAGTEHILLGLMRGGEGIAFEVLSQASINAADVENMIRKYLVSDYSVLEYSGAEYTPMSGRVIQAAVEKANQFKSENVGTEHLLLGILGESDCAGAKVVRAAGVDPHRIYTRILNELRGGNPSQPQRRTPQSDKNSDTKTVEQFAKDLTREALEGRLDPVIGRDEEIKRVIQIGRAHV